MPLKELYLFIRPDLRFLLFLSVQLNKHNLEISRFLIRFFASRRFIEFICCIFGLRGGEEKQINGNQL